MWTHASLRRKCSGSGRTLLAVAGVQLAVACAPEGAQGQLVVENPHQRWKPGETVELVLREQDIRQAVAIDAVLLDDEPIPFELVATRVENDPIRIRIRVPDGIRPGAHELSVLSSVAAVGVPEIVGLTLGQARRRLAARGFDLAAGASFAAPAGGVAPTVTRQRPGAGARARPGTRVAVEIASPVPEILGLGFDEARGRLAERGLEPEPAVAPEGSVIWKQDPPAGAMASPGTRVAVEFAFPVPDLVGRDVDAVRPVLLASGLVPFFAPRAAAGGPAETVLGQQPAAGLVVPPGTAVTVAFESRPDPPDPRWPWPWIAATAALTATLGARVRARRVLRSRYRIEGHRDLDRLLESATAPAWQGRELGLDVRLRGFPDPGRQTLEVNGPLLGEPGR